MSENKSAELATNPSGERTPEIIAFEVRTITASVLVNIIEIGRRFCEAKAILPHGEFGKWLEGVGYKTSTANNFMRLFDEYGNQQKSLFGAELENFQTFGNLSYSKALALLDVPKNEREEFAERHDIEAMTTRELKEAIRKLDEATKRAEEAEQTIREYSEENVELTDSLANAEKRIKELESRPVEVAVQEPDPAEVEKRVDEALRAAQEHHKKELEAVNKKLAEAEKKRKAAEDAKTRAEKAADLAKREKSADKNTTEAEKQKAEIERLTAEAEELRKKLSLSGEAVTRFKLHFEGWQREYGDMISALSGVDEETAAKLRGAVVKIIEGWTENNEKS